MLPHFLQQVSYGYWKWRIEDIACRFNDFGLTKKILPRSKMFLLEFEKEEILLNVSLPSMVLDGPPSA